MAALKKNGHEKFLEETCYRQEAKNAENETAKME
jgi:hypothetical protein